MGFWRIFFLEGAFCLLRGREDLFFFFWSSRPMVNEFYEFYVRVKGFMCRLNVKQLFVGSLVERIQKFRNLGVALVLILSASYRPGYLPSPTERAPDVNTRDNVTRVTPQSISELLLGTRPSWFRDETGRFCPSRCSSRCWRGMFPRLR
jgi:hypothetical protein